MLRRRLLSRTNSVVQVALGRSSNSDTTVFITNDGWDHFDAIAVTTQASIPGSVAISKVNPAIQTVVGYNSSYSTEDRWKTSREIPEMGDFVSVGVSSSNPLVQSATKNNRDYIYSTVNGWSTYYRWIVRGVVSNAGLKVAVSDSNSLMQTAVAYTPTYQSAGGLYTTTDTWASYTQRSNAGNRRWTGVAISSSDPLVQTAISKFSPTDGSSGVLLVTSDGWNTFIQRGPYFSDSEFYSNKGWTNIAISPSDPMIQTATTIEDGFTGYIYTTSDGWVTHQKRTNVGLVDFRGVAISSQDPLVQSAISFNGTVFTTTDGWSTFTSRTIGTALYGIAMS